MNIVSDFNKDIRSPKPSKGSYEWWYFDANSSDKVYSFVIIFYDGNPFSRRYIEDIANNPGSSPEDFPAISISVYKNGKPIYYGFEEVQAKEADFSTEKPRGFVKENTFIGEILDRVMRYDIRLSQTLPDGDRIDASLQFTSKDFGRRTVTESPNNDQGHYWNLVQPKMEVHGQITITGYKAYNIDFSGTGYHDHNMGLEPMRESFKEWYWGRFHLKNSTYVYYIMNQKGVWKNNVWEIFDGGEIKEKNFKIDLSDHQINLFALPSARKIEGKNGDHSFVIQKNHVLDSGPFYQRFGCRILLKRGDEIEQAEGISEYIYPSRIYKKLFWPLVDMRINYPGRTHWVQKNPRLYRWTW